ncbi:MAG: sulfurtransferase complex subunit TusC [Pseudomonadales bacterium]|jgi:tRNA 2-thiouridine synthesizing protein C|nr:sulfurtransferase complex subunit TusC [Pseudomonadales bacterium]
MERLVLLTRCGPYGASAPREALDTALAAAAFELPVTLVFDGDGVLQLLRGQDAAALDEKNLGANLEALPMFDLEDVRVTARSLAARGLTPADLLLPVQVMGEQDLATLLAEADQVLSY